MESIEDSKERKRSSETDFKLERYKFILQEIHRLNENLHKYLALFQALATAIVGAGVAVFTVWEELNISAEMAKTGIRGLLGLLVILALFTVTSVIAGVFSWLDYRKEEVNLLNQEVERGFREMPTIKNLWRWYETYLVLFIFIVIMTIYIYVEREVIPLIQ